MQWPHWTNFGRPFCQNKKKLRVITVELCLPCIMTVFAWIKGVIVLSMVRTTYLNSIIFYFFK